MPSIAQPRSIRIVHVTTPDVARSSLGSCVEIPKCRSRVLIRQGDHGLLLACPTRARPTVRLGGGTPCGLRLDRSRFTARSRASLPSYACIVRGHAPATWGVSARGLTCAGSARPQYHRTANFQHSRAVVRVSLSRRAAPSSASRSVSGTRRPPSARCPRRMACR